MSHTKTVLVSNDAAATSTTVGTGLLVAFVDDAATASSAPWAALNASGSAEKTFQFRTGERSSIRFKGKDVVSSTINDHSGGTAQTITITMAAATTYARDEDGTYSIKLIDVTDGREKFVMKTFQTEAYTADQTGSVIAAAFEVLIDAEGALADSPFTGVSADDGTAGALVITFPVNQFARAASTDSLPAPTYNAAAPSIGLASDVNADVEDALGFQGVTNIAGPNVVKPASVTGTNTYDRTCIFVKETVGMREDIHEIVIYTLASNTTLNGTLDTFLA